MRRYRNPEPGVREYQLQHRVVMEEMLGRSLMPHENVHHKNGERQDNDPSNLELWITKQPSGQRLDDVIAWVVDNYRENVVSYMQATGED